MDYLTCHNARLTNYLSLVKTNELTLWQEICHGSFPDMETTEKPYGEIANRLRWHRELEGLTQNEYAKSIGVKRATLNNWESGDYRLSLDGAIALRRTYGLSIDFMIEGDDDALSMTLRKAWRERSLVNSSG
ncbi:DNA-binding transcriptional regulator, XRE-family HTH domain [Shimia sagamensis]|uniref:DNA-binding transcriptional regulator, XRE-family HTH domain n=2 Tax=Shimia sagamensis TaxID=1566352 RepID=A0ABY1PL43_9RHOB|nr:DNA-binding transcriptional regulator, XRE-family HTH domain [Shimia sagamensis]